MKPAREVSAPTRSPTRLARGRWEGDEEKVQDSPLMFLRLERDGVGVPP